MKILKYFATIFLVAATLSLISCEKSEKSVAVIPCISVIPEHALVDQQVEIIVSNLEPNSQVTLEASARNKEGDTYKSRATFYVDDKGVVNVAKQAPISGSYTGVEPMGLFWSLTSTNKDPYKNTLQAQGTLDPV